MRLRLFIVMFILNCTTGCAIGHNFTKHIDEDFQSKNKSILAPPGAIGMLAVTKEILRENGWKLIALRGPERTVGKLGEDTDLRQYEEATARYILDVKWRNLGTQKCNPNFHRFASIPMTTAFNYSVSFINWRNGVEALSVAGTGCLYDIVSVLRDTIPR